MDLSETPAVEPLETGGDERIGFGIAGAILIGLGWGVAVALNVVLHASAPSTGVRVGPSIITSAMGPYAWAVFALGIGTGALGVGLLWLMRAAPRGPFVLPGVPIGPD